MADKEKPRPDGPDEREARLADALRANLRRRKASAAPKRSRQDPNPPAEEG